MMVSARLFASVVLCAVLVLACIAGAGCIDAAETAPVAVPEAEVNESVVSSPSVPAVSPAPTEKPAGTTLKVTTVPYSGSVVKKSQPTVTQGGYIRVTVTAPYGDHYVSVSSGGIIPDGQPGVDTSAPYTQNYAKIHVDTSGQLSFAIKSVSTDDITVRLVD